MVKNVNLDLKKSDDGYWFIFEDSRGVKWEINIENFFSGSKGEYNCIRQWFQEQFFDHSENEEIKRMDQISMLEKIRDYSETGEWKSGFSYPDCGHDLVRQGLVSEDSKITLSGKAVLFLLRKGKDQTDSKAVQIFEVKI